MKTSAPFGGDFGLIQAGQLREQSPRASLPALRAGFLSRAASVIFVEKSLTAHKIARVLEAFGGDSVAATYGVQDAAQALAHQGTIRGLFEATVQVSGQSVTVRGAVIDGVANLRTAFIR